MTSSAHRPCCGLRTPMHGPCESSLSMMSLTADCGAVASGVWTLLPLHVQTPHCVYIPTWIDRMVLRLSTSVTLVSSWLAFSSYIPPDNPGPLNLAELCSYHHHLCLCNPLDSAPPLVPRPHRFSQTSPWPSTPLKDLVVSSSHLPVFLTAFKWTCPILVIVIVVV